MQVISQNRDQFQDIREILQRHSNLQSSLSKLQKEESRIDSDLKKLKNEYSSYLKKKSSEILMLNLENGKLENDLEVLFVFIFVSYWSVFSFIVFQISILENNWSVKDEHIIISPQPHITLIYHS